MLYDILVLKEIWHKGKEIFASSSTKQSDVYDALNNLKKELSHIDNIQLITG